MSKLTDISLKQVTAATEQIAYRTPIKFGGRVVEDVVLFHVTATVETRDGRVAEGTGSMPVGNVWAWPSRQVTAEQSLDAMIQLSHRLAAAANQIWQHRLCHAS